MQNYNSTKSKTSFNSGLDLSLILSKQWKIFDFKNSLSPSISQLYKQILHLKENFKVSNERRNILSSPSPKSPIQGTGADTKILWATTPPHLITFEHEGVLW